VTTKAAGPGVPEITIRGWGFGSTVTPTPLTVTITSDQLTCAPNTATDITIGATEPTDEVVCTFDSTSEYSGLLQANVTVNGATSDSVSVRLAKLLANQSKLN